MVVVSRDKASSFVPFLSLSKAPKGHCFLSIPFFSICSLSYPSLLISQNPWSLSWKITIKPQQNALWLVHMSPLLDVFSPPLFFLIVTWLCWVQLWHMGALRCHVGSFTPAVQGFSGCGTQALHFPVARGIPVPRPGIKLPCTAKQTPNHWTTREVPPSISKEIISSQSGRCTVPLFLLFSTWWKSGFCPHHSHETVPLAVSYLPGDICMPPVDRAGVCYI